jgi:S-layer homology domain.
MRRTKLVTIMILLLTFNIMTTIPVSAAVSQEIQDKAVALNKLSIYLGVGKDFKFDNNLLRCEAAGFAIRMLGKESYLKQNKDKYTNMGYSDIKKTDWFAAYVGYCTDQGILVGAGGDKFEPNKNISEKSFLKIILCVLGYTYGTDFTWSNIYATAYNVGLVTDSSYLTKTADNPNYKRSQVIDVMYNALTKENKIEKIKQVNVIIKNGAFSKETAMAAGIIKDSVAMALQVITPIDQNSISIKLNEQTETITAGNIKIYETNNTAKVLEPTIVSQQNGEIIVKVAQSPEVAYTVELSNIVDKEGNKSEKLSGSFKGFKPAEIKSDFFKISKIESVGKNLVNLYFTQPINENSELTSCYEFYQNSSLYIKGSNQTIIVKKIGSINNGVSIYLKDMSFTEGTEYQLKVSGTLSSAYGVKLNEMAGDSVTFTGKANNTEGLELKNMQVLSIRTLQLDFNKDINPTIAQQIYNYYITDASNNPIAITNASVSSDDTQNGRSVILTINGYFDKTKTYNLMINNINDVTRQFSITEKSYSFQGYYPDHKDLEVINASSQDAGTIDVYIDRPLNEASAAIVSNFIIVGVTHSGYTATPIKTYYNKSDNPYLIKLFLPSDKLLEGTKTYKLRVMPNLLDNTGVGSSKIIEYGFNSSGSSTAKPTFSDAVMISSDSIKVTFSKEIALDAPNILNSNYKLKYTDNGSAVERIAISLIPYDATTIILRFDFLDFNAKYTLEFDSLKDYSGANIRKASDGLNTIEVRAGK